MVEVQLYRTSNADLYEEFGINPLENIMVSWQLRWLGKITCMEETCLPCKFLTAWHIYHRPVGCPCMTIHHTYLHALKFTGVLEKLDKEGKISDWVPKIQEDPKEWDTFCRSITPNLIGRKIEINKTGLLKLVKGKLCGNGSAYPINII
eukprot:14273058-Ditylum_brightwellii.AAC.1